MDNSVILRRAGILIVFIMVFNLLLPGSEASARDPFRVGILMLGDNREAPVRGLQEALEEHGKEEDVSYQYDIKNTKGDRALLDEYARMIIQADPDVAIAAGGVEADALKAATAEKKIPVVFLAVSSSLNRGLVATMQKPGGNLTGIDTNDPELTAKRLWMITKMFPEARKIRLLEIPGFTPSVESVKVAGESAEKLGLELTVVPVQNEEDIKAAAAAMNRANTDIFLMTPVALFDKAQRPILLPVSLQERIPIMGYNHETLKNGAVASYACNRYETGKQAARLVHKIFHGDPVGEIPVENPQKIDFEINRAMLDRLGITLSPRVLKMADTIFDMDIN